MLQDSSSASIFKIISLKYYGGQTFLFFIALYTYIDTQKLENVMGPLETNWGIRKFTSL